MRHPEVLGEAVRVVVQGVDVVLEGNLGLGGLAHVAIRFHVDRLQADGGGQQQASAKISGSGLYNQRFTTESSGRKS